MAFGEENNNIGNVSMYPIAHNVGMHFVHTSISMEIHSVDENINKTKNIGGGGGVYCVLFFHLFFGCFCYWLRAFD